MRIPIEEHVLDLPRRLREIDDNLRVSFNTDTSQYEIWDMKYEREPFLMAVFNYLDDRVEQAVRRGYADTYKLGWRSLLRRIDEHNERVQRSKDKELEDTIKGMQDDLKFAGKPVIQGWRPDATV